MSSIKQEYFDLMESQYTHEEQEENLGELIEEVQTDYCDRDYVTSGGDDEFRRGEV